MKEYLNKPPLLSQLESNDKLRLYLVVLEYAVSAVLVREVDDQ